MRHDEVETEVKEENRQQYQSQYNKQNAQLRTLCYNLVRDTLPKTFGKLKTQAGLKVRG